MTGVSCACAQPAWAEAAPDASAIARARLASWRPTSWRACPDRELTASTATAPTTESETPTNASASLVPSPSRLAGPWPASAIPGQAEPVAAAEDGLHDHGVGRVFLDLAPQVLHM